MTCRAWFGASLISQHWPWNVCEKLIVNRYVKFKFMKTLSADSGMFTVRMRVFFSVTCKRSEAWFVMAMKKLEEFDVSEVKESDGAIVHGVVTNLSPVKKSK